MATTTQETIPPSQPGEARGNGATRGSPAPAATRPGREPAADATAPAATRPGREPAADATAPAPAGATAAGTEDLAPVSGILDVGDSHAFLRTSGYRPGPDDVYVALSLLHKHGLRRGDQVEGMARRASPSGGGHEPGRNGARRRSKGRVAGGAGGRPGTDEADRGPGQNSGEPVARRPKAPAKYRVLARVETVNGTPSQRPPARPDFEQLTPLYPDERLRLESSPGSPTARIIDLVSPIGKGQRGLIVAPPKAGKTMVLKAIAAAIAATHPEVHLMVVLVGERPEEVTDLRRSVRGEVVYSTFDQSAAEHITVAELAIERAKRLAELGRDVVVLLDSLTRLGRAYNLVAPASSRILAGGVATTALQPPRKFLGAARKLEDGGSLTILSTALVETGSRMDDVLFEEFKGTGNMELRLRRDLAEKRIFPAIDVAPSGTRRDDLLMPADERAAVDKLRRALAGLDAQQALELLLDKTRETSSNLEFLAQVRRGAPAAAGTGAGRS
jgi:transcription termination factor Rho